ncbi:hypothetical protein B0H13DRAFT_1906137 [Mycena leptocephala]|nr:hypothetical protein B0H13DRAFT_1906137 [Mycena leptocephala]
MDDAVEGQPSPARITPSNPGHGLRSSAAEVRRALYPHQIDHGKDLNEGRDVFLVIAPGLEKSIVLFAPLTAAQARGERGIAFMIVPTKVLAEQQIRERKLTERTKAEVGRKYGLRTTAINEDWVTEAATREERDLFAESLAGMEFLSAHEPSDAPGP